MDCDIIKDLLPLYIDGVCSESTKKNVEEVRSQINSAIRFIMLISIPCAVGMGVLAEPILKLVHLSDESGMAAIMLRYGAVSIIFFSLSTLSNGLLQGINRMKEPVKNAAMALILHVIVLIVFDVSIDSFVFFLVFVYYFFW